jgi:mortality factor 4-like protein 1
VLPDLLKGLLVDDWENITKNNQLVPLPHPKPVTLVLDNYLQYEKAQRQEGSASIDILEETIAGLKEYFDKCLGRILLYR